MLSILNDNQSIQVLCLSVSTFLLFWNFFKGICLFLYLLLCVYAQDTRLGGGVEKRGVEITDKKICPNSSKAELRYYLHVGKHLLRKSNFKDDMAF